MVDKRGAGDLVELPDAPSIRGLKIRHFVGESDYPKILAVMEGMKAADGLDSSSTLADIERDFRHMEHCDPFRDFLIAEVDGKAVACTYVWWDMDGSGNYLFSQYVFMLPEWRKTGPRNAMLRHNERVLKRLGADLPKESPRFLQSIVMDTEKDWISVLESEGYFAFRHGLGLNRRDLENVPDLLLPSGLEIRPVKKEHYRVILNAWNEACRDMRGQIPISDETFKQWQESPSFDPSLWLIVWHEETVIGTVLNFIDPEENERSNRKRGHVEFVSVRRTWRRRGLARTMIAMSLKLLKDRGMTEAAIGVDEENPSGARHLYESMGFVVEKRATFYRKPLG